MRKLSLIGCSVLLGLAADAAYALPVIPGASGFGIDTPAGRGGKVYRVTNLNDSGTGSLRDCIERSGPRVCVFEVSGTIRVNSRIEITNPYLTIAGQTAPSPGITLRGGNVLVKNTHDVLIQHIRIRVGDDPDGIEPTKRDGFGITAPSGGQANNVVLDHVSISWAVDENIQLWYSGVSDVTLRNVISSEALYDSIHPDGPHSMGLIIGEGIDRVSVVDSILAHNRGRNPRMRGPDGVVFANNVIYNAGTKAVDIGEGSSNTRYSIVGNVFLKGRDTESVVPVDVRSNVPSGTKIFEADNSADFSSTMMNSYGETMRVSSAPIWPNGLKARSKGQVMDYVLATAGARPADRDDVDKRVLSDIKNGTGRRIDSQYDVGGWPDLAVNKRPLELPNNPNGDDDGDGYTNLEEWLHMFSEKVEGGAGPGVPMTPQGVTVQVVKK